MRKMNFRILVVLSVFFCFKTNAQIASASDSFVAQPVTDRDVMFDVSKTGIFTPINWGLDLAWLSEGNIRRGIGFMGLENIDVVRSSFTPTAPLVDGHLATVELGRLNERLALIDLLGSHTKVVLNCDHPSVDPWFKDANGVGIASRWAQLMDETTRLHQEHGRTVVTISPFNEPDYTGTGQGTITDFYNICGELEANSRFDDIRISGGNTLNNDVALTWFNTLKDRLDEGNTHQLAGNFDSYANFFQTVSAQGYHATNDELHNVMEAMVGVEYGLQTGIWWGTAEYARGEFVKASDGTRLGYSEHRPNWTAASVYKKTTGAVQGFVGSSERQAATTTYKFVSEDRDVFYDGHGPQREYVMEIPGGTGYQQGQTNAEAVVNITWGDDIQPVINGTYLLVNRNSGKVMEITGGSTSAGANLRQGTNTGATHQQWQVTPVSTRIGGDFSYFTFASVNSNKSPDILNWSLDNGANIIVWDNLQTGNQQWYLDYNEDGWFYIRSRHSALCLDVYNSSTANGANISQWEKNGGTNQQWRFIPIDAEVEFVAPSAPTNLVATANAESVKLDWTASPETDVAGYTILRSESTSGPYNVIARDITSTSFVDNTPTLGGQFFYVVKALDYSLNSSIYSNEVSATTTEANDLVAHYKFDSNILDTTINLNHSATLGNVSFVTGNIGTGAIDLNGTNTFVQLPSTIANQEEISIATWVYWDGGNAWQRIFDFGNGENENMYLTPSSGSGQLRFAIKAGSSEQSLNASSLPTGQWSHVVVSLGDSKTSMYVNGVLVDQSSSISAKPTYFNPIFNYIGRSQYPDPLLNGKIDDFRIYNYALDANQVAKVYNSLAVEEFDDINSALTLWKVPADDVLYLSFSGQNQSLSTIKVFDLKGRLVLSNETQDASNTEINVSNLASGMYILKFSNRDITIKKKFVVKH